MTYEYVCTACHHEWEAEQSISAPPLQTCPNCNENAAKRQISRGGGFILKGGGWYADGYGSSSSSSSGSGSGSVETKKTETPKTESTTNKTSTPSTTTDTTPAKTPEKSSDKKSSASAAV